MTIKHRFNSQKRPFFLEKFHSLPAYQGWKQRAYRLLSSFLLSCDYFLLKKLKTFLIKLDCSLRRILSNSLY